MDDRIRKELIDALEAQAHALTGLAEAMRERRGAFLAADPARSLQQTVELDALARSAVDAERRRAEAFAQACRTVDLDRRARFKDLVRRLPDREASSLVPVVERVRRAAEALRLEGAVGADLLRTGSRAHEGIVRRLVSGASEGPGIYDQRSRNVQMAQGTGRLIDGRV